MAAGSVATLLDSTTPGTSAAGKPVVLDSNKAIDQMNIIAPYFGAGAGVAMTATSAELNYNAGVTPGTTLASKTLIVDANKAVTELHTAALYLGATAGTLVTATAAEVNVLASVTAGTVSASKAVVVDANSSITGLKQPLGTATTGQCLSVRTANATFTPVTSGTTQNTEYPLSSYTLPANALSADGKTLRITAWGTLAANADAKTLKLYFGSQVIATITGSTESGTPFWFSAMVMRTGASTQTIVAQLIVTATIVAVTVTAGTQDSTATILIKDASINTGAAAASATGLAMTVEYLA